MSKPVEYRIEDLQIILLDEARVMEIEQWLAACENCAENAAVALDYIFDALTGCGPELTEYLMCRPACCPCCAGEITEKTLVVV
jgi:hypothetical protein